MYFTQVVRYLDDGEFLLNNPRGSRGYLSAVSYVIAVQAQNEYQYEATLFEHGITNSVLWTYVDEFHEEFVEYTVYRHAPCA